MLSRFKFFYILSGFFLLFAINPKFVSNTNAEESLKIDLNSELKKGSFLIGLKQYLGGTNDSFSQNNNITFKVDKGFLNLHSFNGIKHKSKKINIIWKYIPIKTPDTIERLVFGPFASYESAQKQAKNLISKGFEATPTFIPARLANQECKLFECCGPWPQPLPTTALITIGTFDFLFDLKYHNDIQLTIASNEYNMKSTR